MTLQELRELLEPLGIPVKYRAFKVGEAPNLPYIIFYKEDNQGTLKADNQNYAKVGNITIELYSDEKDIGLEEQLDSILDTNEIDYDTYESYLDTESMYEVAYEITI